MRRKWFAVFGLIFFCREGVFGVVNGVVNFFFAQCSEEMGINAEEMGIIAEFIGIIAEEIILSSGG